MKRIVSVLLCCVLIFSYIYVPSSAAEEKTVLYLNYGNITIKETEITGYDKDGKKVTQTNPAGYIITQKSSKNTIDKGITVSSATCSIELLNLNIKRYNEYDSAFYIKSTSDVTVTLSGENHLISGAQHAGLEVGTSSKLTINGDGTLYAQSSLQAGIGGGSGHSNGTVVIDSGTIYATGGIDGYSAGIGGGSLGKGGNITINGGFVYAQGGMYAAGIGGGDTGGGGNITINGGVVTAIGGEGGAGIGGGYAAGSETNIIINGGSVKAVAGVNADDIGNGEKAKTAFSGIHNSNGTAVSLVNVPVNNFESIYINGIDTSPITEIHPDDDKLYIYTDRAGKVITEYMNDGSVDFFKVTNKTVTQLYPYSGERFEDKLITEDTASISVASGFSVNENKDLMYNSLRVDTFTPALRGDVNFDGNLDGMDAVIVNCVVNAMLNDNLTTKLSDADGSGTVNENDVDLLIQYGLGGN